ncbi:hypothetical protein Tco_0998943 [Tanacetum coccineum]
MFAFGYCRSIFHLHNGLGDTKAVWDKLQETFEGTDRVKVVKLLTLKREFELLRMKDNELVKDYSARMMDMVNQMRLHGEVVKDQKVVEKIMICVPPKFEAKISAIEESEEIVEGAFRVSSRSNKAGNSKQNTFIRGNFSKGNNKGSTLQNSSSTSKKGVQQANVSENNQVDDEHLFMASHLDKHLDSLTWLIDSGCISNMTPERSFFISLDTKDNPRVKLGDGRYTRAKGRATLDMENDSYYLKLDVVEFVKTPYIVYNSRMISSHLGS